jgi:hypothetical protein
MSTPFYEACALLWLASQPKFSYDLPLKIFHIGVPVACAKGVGTANILLTTCSGRGLSGATQATKNLTDGCGLLHDSIVASMRQQFTSKESKGFKKLPTHIPRPLSSKPPSQPAGYADAQGTLVCMEPATK